MLGAIIGDIVGSRFEWNNIKTKEFELFTDECFITDDSIMTLAIAKAILTSDGICSNVAYKSVEWMRAIGRKYPNCGYGSAFCTWMFSDHPQPYHSFGNGAAMRISAAAYAAHSLDEAKQISQKITAVTHDHPEGLKGAEAVVAAIYLAITKLSLQEIRDYIDQNYYPMDFTLDEIRPTYQFNETCQETVPQALMAFFESTGFEDAIRNAISIGGDSDTVAAITGSVAEAYYDIPAHLRKAALPYLPQELLQILEEFEDCFPTPIPTRRQPGALRNVAEMHALYALTVQYTQTQLAALVKALEKTKLRIWFFHTNGDREYDCGVIAFERSFPSLEEYLYHGTEAFRQETDKGYYEVSWTSTVIEMSDPGKVNVRVSIDEANREQREAGLQTSEVRLWIYDLRSMSAPTKTVSVIAEALADAGVIQNPEELYGGREIIIDNRNKGKTPRG